MKVLSPCWSFAMQPVGCKLSQNPPGLLSDMRAQSPSSLPHEHTHTGAHTPPTEPTLTPDSHATYQRICSQTHTHTHLHTRRASSGKFPLGRIGPFGRFWASGEPRYLSLRGYQRVKREHFQGVCLLINTVNSFPFTNINSWQSVTEKERGKKKP